MFEVIVPLRHIIFDPASPMDLTALPESEAIELIVKSYGFLSPAIQVSIVDGVAHIRLDEPRSQKIADALGQYQRGVKEAQRGEYQKSIKHFTKVLEAIPQHVDARRNLAMAHLEQGKVGPAKELLQECLKLDPTNIWSIVLLGNLYAKHERNPDAAAFYYEAGLLVNPGDNILLNNFAALQMERGKLAEAKGLFERALVANPDYPNTYYGLAMLHKVARESDQAIELLERLFDRPKSADIRSEPVYQNARTLYAELCAEVATRDSGKLMGSVIAGKQQLEVATGHPISIEEDASLEYVSATAQMAWKHGRDEHRVRYRQRSPAMMPHLLAHELEHIALEHEARIVDNNRLFCSNAKTREYAIRSVADHIAKLQRQGYSEANIGSVIQSLVHGLCNQVFNCPLDMVVEHNIFAKYPGLRYSQFASLRQMHEEALKTYTSQEIRRLTPPLHISCQRHS